jgi:hypothetical protein
LRTLAVLAALSTEKPSKFTDEEKEKLNHTLSDLSKKLGSIRIL